MSMPNKFARFLAVLAMTGCTFTPLAVQAEEYYKVCYPVGSEVRLYQKPTVLTDQNDQPISRIKITKAAVSGSWLALAAQENNQLFLFHRKSQQDESQDEPIKWEKQTSSNFQLKKPPSAIALQQANDKDKYILLLATEKKEIYKWELPNSINEITKSELLNLIHLSQKTTLNKKPSKIIALLNPISTNKPVEHLKLLNANLEEEQALWAYVISDSTITLWDIEQPARTTTVTLTEHTDRVQALAIFTPENQTWLASGSDDCTIKIWPLRQSNSPYKCDPPHKCVATLPAAQEIQDLRLHLDEVQEAKKYLINKRSKYSDPESKKSKEINKRLKQRYETINSIHNQLEKHDGQIATLTVVANRWLVSGDHSGTLTVWDVMDLKNPVHVATAKPPETSQIVVLESLSQDTFITIDENGKTTTWQLTHTGQ